MSLHHLLHPLAILVAFLVAAPTWAQGTSIPIFSQTVPLDPRQPERRALGQLVYRGGVALRSSDRRFGGFSGLHVSANGRWLTAISDRGRWLRLRLKYTRAGDLAGAVGARMGPLRGRKGQLLSGWDADAEALTLLPDGAMVVAFERNHRIRVYPPGGAPFGRTPRVYALPPGVEDGTSNGGLETLVHVGRGYLFALSERQRAGPGLTRGWVGVDGGWLPLAYVRRPGFRPTDGALLPNGDLLILERRFLLGLGATIRFMHLPRRAIGPRRTLRAREIARLTRRMTVDNFEGIAIRQGRRQRTLIYVISDDNFSPLQRTLLLMFELAGSGRKPAR